MRYNSNIKREYKKYIYDWLYKTNNNIKDAMFLTDKNFYDILYGKKVGVLNDTSITILQNNNEDYWEQYYGLKNIPFKNVNLIKKDFFLYNKKHDLIFADTCGRLSFDKYVDYAEKTKCSGEITIVFSIMGRGTGTDFELKEIPELICTQALDYKAGRKLKYLNSKNLILQCIDKPADDWYSILNIDQETLKTAIDILIDILCCEKYEEKELFNIFTGNIVLKEITTLIEKKKLLPVYLSSIKTNLYDRKYYHYIDEFNDASKSLLINYINDIYKFESKDINELINDIRIRRIAVAAMISLSNAKDINPWCLEETPHKPLSIIYQYSNGITPHYSPFMGLYTNNKSYQYQKQETAMPVINVRPKDYPIKALRFDGNNLAELMKNAQLKSANISACESDPDKFIITREDIIIKPNDWVVLNPDKIIVMNDEEFNNKFDMQY